MLIANTRGRYRFLKGIEPYSCGVVADPGQHIVHALLREWLPWRQGFKAIDAHLRERGLERVALCAVELRSPVPFTMQGFIDFNREYCQVLEQWGLYVDGLNPLARTNIAPVYQPPEEPSLHAFSYIVPAPAARARPSFVVAGAGELREALLEEARIIRPGDTSPASMRDKAAYVLQVMEERLAGLGMGWEGVTAADVYTVYAAPDLLEEVVFPRLGPAGRHGLRWHWARPPVRDIDFEMDLRGGVSEIEV